MFRWQAEVIDLVFLGEAPRVSGKVEVAFLYAYRIQAERVGGNVLLGPFTPDEFPWGNNCNTNRYIQVDIVEVSLFLEGKVMSIYKGKALLMTVVTLALVGSACLFSPNKGKNKTPSMYHSPVDTPVKLLENFVLAYQTKNINAYMDCLHGEFEFKLLEVDWDDYTGNGEIDESWGRDLEELYTGNMFASQDAEEINLTLEGNNETIWFGDSTGTTLQLVRSFNLKVYFTEPNGTINGFQAVGQAVFLCKPNADGDYVIWRWEDQSET